jgi:hypothetical protein
VFNTILVSSIVAMRLATRAFLFWATLEIGLAALRRHCSSKDLALRRAAAAHISIST